MWNENYNVCRKLSFYYATIGNWLRICLFESKYHIVFSTEPEAFCGVDKVAPIDFKFIFLL